MKRAADLQAEWWDTTRTIVRERLARIDRGESWASEQSVRVWRLLVGDSSGDAPRDFAATLSPTGRAERDSARPYGSLASSAQDDQ